ncbi:hypothetical protein KL86PLE_70155 [uncultured Pleomorphomonas sp.]|uniref:Uncharacterized protein n=1 Tax=uncultured Pleomorphomonas sp. TaxID=442121 RepID=A0A212LLW9_9HYPH|nr:hypothetical protein KL86PLE_70155 [uncultured Pleomorphomonas sp.]
MHDVFAMRLNTELSFEVKVVNPKYDLDERLNHPPESSQTFRTVRMRGKRGSTPDRLAFARGLTFGSFPTSHPLAQ